jgi:hypothetical protein
MHQKQPSLFIIEFTKILLHLFFPNPPMQDILEKQLEVCFGRMPLLQRKLAEDSSLVAYVACISAERKCMKCKDTSEVMDLMVGEQERLVCTRCTLLVLCKTIKTDGLKQPVEILETFIAQNHPSENPATIRQTIMKLLQQFLFYFPMFQKKLDEPTILKWVTRLGEAGQCLRCKRTDTLTTTLCAPGGEALVCCRCSVLIIMKTMNGDLHTDTVALLHAYLQSIPPPVVSNQQVLQSFVTQHAASMKDLLCGFPPNTLSEKKEEVLSSLSSTPNIDYKTLLEQMLEKTQQLRTKTPGSKKLDNAECILLLLKGSVQV